MRLNKRTWEAAGWTFLQAFLTIIIPALTVSEQIDLEAFKGVLYTGGLSALAAALSVIKSAIVQKISATGDILFAPCATCGKAHPVEEACEIDG